MCLYSIGISKYGFPESSNDIHRLGELANAFGATGVQSVGGVPVQSSRYGLASSPDCSMCVVLYYRQTIQKYLQHFSSLAGQF